MLGVPFLILQKRVISSVYNYLNYQCVENFAELELH